MPRNLLPRLVGNIAPATPGAWTIINSPGELARLDLGVQADDEVRSRVQSIPSPWARMLLFRLALQDPAHPARRLVENELLDALQFLWSVNERPNSTLRHDTFRLVELQEAAEKLTSEKSEWWSRALVELMPRKTRVPEPGLESISVVRAAGIPLIASSPFTILFTAESAASAPRDVTGSFFRYALGEPARRLHERPMAFQRYVAQVLVPQLEDQATIVNANTDVHAVQSSVKQWLQQEVTQCRRTLPSTQLGLLEPPSSGDWRSAARTLGLVETTSMVGGPRLFERQSGAEMHESTWILRPKREGAPTPPLIIQPSRFDGRYYPGAPTINLPTDLEGIDRQTLPQTATRYPWVYPEKHWFAEQLLILAQPLQTANVFGLSNFRSLYSGDRTYLRVPQFTLPLKREVLQFFTPEEIDRRLSIEVQPSGHVDVTFRVPIGPTEQEATIKRRYDEASFFHEVTGPELTIWPRFRSDSWKDYTLFRRDENANVAQFIAIHGIVAGEQLDEDSEQRNEVARVSSFERAPEAVEFSSLITGGASAQRLGLVLPRYRAAQPVGPTLWNVGIDFGTSNTVVSVRQGTAIAPALLKAENLTLPLTDASADTLSLLDAYFLPHSLAPRPFGTAAVVFEGLKSFNLYSDRIGVRVNVPFSGHVQRDEKNRVQGDLKWSDKPGVHFVTQTFVRHVLAVVLAQAVERGVDPRHVTVSWSYPRAFTPAQVNRLRDLWNDVRRYFQDRLGGIGEIRQGVDESQAVLRFFANDQTITTAGDVNVVVDVGGATSDLAIYGYGRTIALDSITLGGRNLSGTKDSSGSASNVRNPFVTLFVAWANQNSLPEYPLEQAAVAKYLLDDQDHLAFAYLVQSKWFERHGSRFSASQAAQRFQTIVLYLFSALAYYIGLSLRAAARDDTNKSFVPVTLMLAGNGSQYVRWLTDLTDAPLGEFGAVLGRMLVRGMGSTETGPVPRIDRTPEPKHEVALGLIAGSDIVAADHETALNCPIVGEAVTIRLGADHREATFAPGDRLPAGASMTARDVPTVQWSDGELEIERFHDAFIKEVECLNSHSEHWSSNAKDIRELFQSLPRRELQQLTKARLERLTAGDTGFTGSFFIVEATAVMSLMQERFFASTDRRGSTPARATRAQ